MSRLALPQKYILNSGISLETFESLDNWSQGSNGTIEVNPLQYMSGNNSLKLSATSPGVSFTATKTVNLDLHNHDGMFKLWVYCHDDIANISSIMLYLSPTTDWSKFFVAELKPQILQKGLRFLLFVLYRIPVGIVLVVDRQLVCR